MRHLSGSANLPSDFACRNAPDCDNPNCQICSFVAQLEDSTVNAISVQDVLSGSAKLPFTTRLTWLATQSECADLRQVHAHLKQGTRPSKKVTNARDVKRYLSTVSVARDGLLVVRKEEPFAPVCECVANPWHILPGLLTALHTKLEHPISHQLKQVVNRYFFALDLDQSIDHTTSSCHQCATLKQFPHMLVEQSTCHPPEAVGVNFAADVIRRQRQFILVLRESVTSFTCACIVDNERHSTLREALLRLCAVLRSPDGPTATIRTGPAPGFQSLAKDTSLRQHGIVIDLGRTKNKNKNPVAEKAVQELKSEILRQDPSGNPVSPLNLALAVSRLNSHIRGRGLSACEMWVQSDQFTSSQLHLLDQQLIADQQLLRKQNHPHSQSSKNPKGRLKKTKFTPVGVGGSGH